MPVYLNHVASAVPALYLSQEEAFNELVSQFDIPGNDREMYRKIMLGGTIKGRHIAMRDPSEASRVDPDQLIERFLEQARLIGAEAARRAMEAAGITSSDITGLVVNTCTGYVCPGLSSYLIEDLGLPTQLHMRDIMGMGCGGALPNLDTARGLLLARSAKEEEPGCVLSIAVEICTATLYLDPDPGVIISNSIFADGAAAVVVSDHVTAGSAEYHDFETTIAPQHRAELMYRHENHKLRNVLSRRVPVLAGQAINTVVERLLRRNQLAKDEIDHWVVHPGGTEILASVEKSLELDSSCLQHSLDVFQSHGNMSSPSVLFVLEKMIREDKPAPGSWAVLVSFGAGFSAFAILLRF